MAIKIELNQFEVGNLDKRSFDPAETNYLGKYIYALRDPRDRKIFYIGQGTGNRVFEHFAEAEDVVRGNKTSTSKTLRIIDVWISKEDVDWMILARELSQIEADKVESAAIDAMQESQNGLCLNQNKGPKSTLSLPEDISKISMKMINPKFSCRVFVFPIANALASGQSLYDATRRLWRVTPTNRRVGVDFAVGLVNGVSRSCYKIAQWTTVAPSGKCEFDSTPVGALDPVFVISPPQGENWANIIAPAKGYWQRGNYLIVEFDGQGKFRVIRGAGSMSSWSSC